MIEFKLFGTSIQMRFPYDPKMVSLVKQIPDREYVNRKGDRYWKVPHTAWHCTKILEVFGPDVPAWISKQAKGYVQPKPKKKPVLEGLKMFQSEAVEFIRANGGSGLLGDDMGLGKTVEFLALVKLEDYNRVLIAVPAVTLKQWEKHVIKWTDRTAHVIELTKDPLPSGSRFILLMSYDMMRLRYDDLKEIDFDLFGFDECHYLKNHKAQRTLVAKALVKRATKPRVVGMSGTPFLNRPSELFSILNLIDPVLWPSFFSYGKRYCWDGVSYKGAINRAELSERLKHTMIRRLKEDVLDELPPIQRTVIPVSFAKAKDRNEYTKERAKLMKMVSYKEVVAQLSVLRQLVGQVKADLSLEFIRDYLEQTDRKLVLYCHHHSVVDYLREQLKDYQVGMITGRESKKIRDATKDAFTQQPEPRLLMISSAGGVGLDLFGEVSDVISSDILFIEREWTPALEEQAEGRLHRMGQNYPVSSYYLLLLNTMDERIERKVESKRRVYKDIAAMFDIKTNVMDEILVEEFNVETVASTHRSVKA